MIRIALCLMLGAIINVGIAWGCTQYVNPASADPQSERLGCASNGPGYAHWFVTVNDFSGGQGVVSYWALPPEKWKQNLSRAPDAILPQWARFARPRASHGSLVARRYVVEARGWPVPLMAAVIRTDRHRSNGDDGRLKETTTELAIRGGHYACRSGLIRHSRLFPIRPLWPGFALGMLMYGGALWLALVAPRTVRGVVRAHQGRCCRCGYDLRGLITNGETTNCPECGAPSAARGRAGSPACTITT